MKYFFFCKETCQSRQFFNDRSSTDDSFFKGLKKTVTLFRIISMKASMKPSRHTPFQLLHFPNVIKFSKLAYWLAQTNIIASGNKPFQ